MGVLSYLEIVGHLQVVILDNIRVNQYTTEERLLARATHYDFYKNRQCLDVHGWSYTDYIVRVIDACSS